MILHSIDPNHFILIYLLIHTFYPHFLFLIYIIHYFHSRRPLSPSFSYSLFPIPFSSFASYYPLPRFTILTLFFYSIGHPLSSFQRIKEIGFSTWLRGLQYWPFVHAIMHRFVPIQHQTLFAHFCSLYWNAVLSYYVNLKIE